MSREMIRLDGPLLDYFTAHAFREDALLARLRAETEAMPERGMQIAPEQGALLALLVKLAGVRRAIEVGTFTGYSALATARALPEGGTLICCDVSERFTAIARRYWAEAGVAGRIDLRIAPALDTLAALRNAGGDGGFDQVFIDADKANYAAYYEQGLALLRPGGLMLVDNTLWSGAVADTSDTSADTRAIRALNATIAADPRVEHCLLPIADGMTMVRKL
jgi:predicted O-methyltransferase YrrM